MTLDVTEQAQLDSDLNGHPSTFGAQPKDRPNRLGNEQADEDWNGHRHLAQDECPVQFAITLIQGKWKIGILYRLQYGPARLSQLRRMLPQASKKMLTQHLREMERDGLIVRTDLSGRMRRVEYSLSGSLGFAALHLINTLAHWGSQYAPPRSLKERMQGLSDE